MQKQLINRIQKSPDKYTAALAKLSTTEAEPWRPVSGPLITAKSDHNDTSKVSVSGATLDANEPREEEPDFSSTQLVIILLMIFCSPVGFVLYWLSPHFSKKWKLRVTGIVLSLLVIGFLTGDGDDKKDIGPSRTVFQSADNTGNIIKAHNQLMATVNSWMQSFDSSTTFDQQATVTKTALGSINRIDISQCPPDYKRAFADVVYVLTQVHTGVLANDVSTSERLAEQFGVTLAKLASIAESHGVEFQSDTTPKDVVRDACSRSQA